MCTCICTYEKVHIQKKITINSCLRLCISLFCYKAEGGYSSEVEQMPWDVLLAMKEKEKEILQSLTKIGFPGWQSIQQQNKGFPMCQGTATSEQQAFQ